MTAFSSRDLQPASRGRLLWLDLARGIAVIAMVVYHLSWDLSFNQLIETEINEAFGWRLFARAIAASFLALSGFSLWIAHGRGVNWLGFWRREGLLVAAAALVSLGTWYAFPDAYVFFGILHCIAAASLIGLACLRLPVLATLAVAALCLAAPSFLASERFDPPLLAFLGLRTTPPRTNDYVPLLPWLAPFLMGLAAARALPASATGRGRDPGAFGRAVRVLGRHSLLIYLIHQPLLFGATSLAASWLAAPRNDAAGAFLSACEADCVRQGTLRQTCVETCFCTLDGLEKTGAWTAIAKGATDPKALEAIRRMSSVCQR